jgi:endonuclease YncB( thermonuclease family)
MSPGRVLAGIAVAVAACVLAAAGSATPQPFTQRGTIVSVVDPATLDVRLTGKTAERVKLIGLQPPAVGSCAYGPALADLNTLVAGKPVWILVVPPRGAPAKKRSPVTAYVILSGGVDVGLELVRRGDATVRRDQGPFKESAAYKQAQKAAQASSLGLWGCTSGGTPTVPAAPAPSQGQGQGQGQGQSQGQSSQDHGQSGEDHGKNGKSQSG